MGGDFFIDLTLLTGFYTMLQLLATKHIPGQGFSYGLFQGGLHATFAELDFFPC